MNIGINGFGRIGRLVFRIIETKRLAGEDIRVTAINCSMTNKQLLHLLQYDSVHGKFPVVSEYADESCITINNNIVFRSQERSPDKIDWYMAGAEYVIDCTGAFKTIERAGLHLQSNVKKVIISSPSNDIPMFVMGANHDQYNGETIVSNASCTTNCLAPLVKLIHNHSNIQHALMSTIHSTTSSQNTLDNKSKKNLRGGRCSLNNIIPTSTGAAKCVGNVIPELKGKISGMAFRVPIANVSVVDLTIQFENPTSFRELMNCIKKASLKELKGIVGYTEEELVSSDFIGDPRSCIVDIKASMELNPTFFKIVAWYDNEWGYSNRLVDLLKYINYKNILTIKIGKK